MNNIGSGAAKEIVVRWHFNEEKAVKIITGKYAIPNYEIKKDRYEFVLANDSINVRVPDLFIYTLGRKTGTMPGHLLAFIELSYKDTAGHQYKKIYRINSGARDNITSLFPLSVTEIDKSLLGPTSANTQV